MNLRSAAAMLFLAIPLFGCTSVNVALEGEVDPALSPKSSPVAVVLPDNPTIEERQIYPVLLGELSQDGYTVTDPSLAVWILGVGTRRDVQFAGYSMSGGVVTTKIGDLAISGGNAQGNAEYKNTVLINLWLFHAADYRNGKRVSVWEGSETTDLETFHTYPKLLVSGLLKILGHNFYSERQDLNDDLWEVK